MTFPELLNEYINILNCTASELAEASGLTSASLSRYRNGQRMPEADTLSESLRLESQALHVRTEKRIFPLILFFHGLWKSLVL